MIKSLQVLFVVILGSMIWVTTWAGLQCPLFGVPRAVATHPWFIATMFDAYWGFITFYVWVFYKESRWLPRIAWFAAIMLLGNMAMSAYVLLQLRRLAPGQSTASMLTARNS